MSAGALKCGADIRSKVRLRCIYIGVAHALFNSVVQSRSLIGLRSYCRSWMSTVILFAAFLVTYRVFYLSNLQTFELPFLMMLHRLVCKIANILKYSKDTMFSQRKLHTFQHSCFTADVFSAFLLNSGCTLCSLILGLRHLLGSSQF